MKYIYTLTNTITNKKFVGKSQLDKESLENILYIVLDSNQHYNKLLQKDWNKYPFKLEFVETDNCVEDYDNMIKNENLLNPAYGYNMFKDLSHKRGKQQKSPAFADDICLLYSFHEDIQLWSSILKQQRNTLANKLANFDIFTDGYYTPKISKYEDYYWTALRLLYLEEESLTSNQLMDKMLTRYDISPLLRVTTRKISKFFMANQVGYEKKKIKGCLIFNPKAENHNSDEE